MNSLYAAYEKSPAGFAERYLDLLAAGGTKHYREALAPFGLDPSDPAFWNKGLEMISGLIRELEHEVAASNERARQARRRRTQQPGA